jgi:hypothetical protein
MEEFHVCQLTDLDELCEIMDISPYLYGHNTKESGIINLQKKHFENLLSTQPDPITAKELIVAHKIDGKIESFAMMRFWEAIPSWTMPIGFARCDVFERKRLAYTYVQCQKFMMDLAEQRSYYDCYVVVRHSTHDFKREFVLYTEKYFPKYNFNKIEIIPKFSNSKYSAFKMLNVAGKNTYPLAVLHGSCKAEHRKPL